MSRVVTFRPVARLEFDEAADWFEGKQVGLGLRFTAAIRDELNNIKSNPSIYRKVYREVRVTSVKGFPYQIFYRVLNDESIEILSVFQIRRNPSVWRERVE